MYLAPLNYDRFFKKVFGQKKFARAFLQDFLDIKIEDIEILERKNFITDKALPVEFDYRCKLDNGEIVIVEMQQWYKTDVIKRFYLYHALSTSLQLETLEEQIVSIDSQTGNIIKDKLYNDLKPAITLIWMVDDTLNFKEDFVSFKMGVEELHDFVKDNELWTKPFEQILKERERVLNIQNNDTKGLNFLSESRLTFIFQKNIVKNLKNNKNKNGKYGKWFDFAKKTNNKKNKRADFKNYKDDKLFMEIMNILLKDRLTEEEIKYITKEDELKEAYLKYTSVIIEKEKKVIETSKKLKKLSGEVENLSGEVENLSGEVENLSGEVESLSKKAKEAEKREEEAKKEKEEALREKEKARIEKKLMIENMLNSGLSVKDIAKFTGLTPSEIKNITN